MKTGLTGGPSIPGSPGLACCPGGPCKETGRTSFKKTAIIDIHMSIIIYKGHDMVGMMCVLFIYGSSNGSRSSGRSLVAVRSLRPSGARFSSGAWKALPV